MEEQNPYQRHDITDRVWGLPKIQRPYGKDLYRLRNLERKRILSSQTLARHCHSYAKNASPFLVFIKISSIILWDNIL